MAMFGGMSKLPSLSGPTSPPPPEPQRKRRFTDTLGLVGDILTGNGMTGSRLASAQAATMPQQIKVGDSLVSVDPRTGQVETLFDGRKPASPHYWETNNGSLGMIGADGQPQIAYQDPTPKQGVVAIDNADGTKTLYPTVNGLPVGLGAQPAQAGGIPIQNGQLPPGFKLRGGAASGQQGFRP